MRRKILIWLAIQMLTYSVVHGYKTKTIKIGCNENYYPYIIAKGQSGELEGVIIDWWNLWADKTGVEIELIPLSIEECIVKTTEGEIDAIAGLFFSEERGNVLDFTEPLMRMKTVLYLKMGLKPDSLELFADTVGVLKNDLSYFFLKERYPEISLKVYDDYKLLKKEIRNKNIAGFVHDVPNPIRKYKTPSPPDDYYAYEILYAEKLRIAVKSGNSEMLNLIISGASDITDEELFAIAEQWEFFKLDKRLTWIIGISAILALALISFMAVSIVKSKRRLRGIDSLPPLTDWLSIIAAGENDAVEFKSSLSWDYRLKRPNRILERAVIKTITAFLNTSGGMLFIGVDDTGKILGLENDYKCLNKRNRDGFYLALSNLINLQLGKSNHKYITYRIHSFDKKDICLVKVKPSNRPVFLGANDNEKFYIRASASSQPLGVRETHKYINAHWK